MYRYTDNDEKYMRLALDEAEKAYALGEVPVGAIVVKDGEVIACAGNSRETLGSAINHAEMIAIDRACKKLGSWRLSGCTLYVTLEPCPMCAGAVMNSRIDRVVFGARDARAGALGSLIDLNTYPLNHKVECVFGVLEAECTAILRKFFEEKR